MGVLDHNHTCKMCGLKNTFCPGHFGHIQLAKPVFNCHFFDYVLKILKCVCFRCSKLRVDPESPEAKVIINKKIPRKKKFDLMYKLCSKANCCSARPDECCGSKQPDKIAKDKEGVFRVLMEWKNFECGKNKKGEAGDDDDSDGEENSGVDEKTNIKKQIFNAEDILRIFRRITDADVEAIGMSHKLARPEWLICTVLPVPPPALRPSVRNDAGQRSEDDLTHKLSSIIKVNQSLKQKLAKNATKEQFDIWVQVLQLDVATLVDNNIPRLPQSNQRTGRPIKSISERLKGKEGRVRANLMGKRVDFSARSVITPDPNRTRSTIEDCDEFDLS